MVSENKIYTAAEIKEALLKITEIYEGAGDNLKQHINYYLKNFVKSNKLKLKKDEIEEYVKIDRYYIESALDEIAQYMDDK